jgi:hypothetical protein
MLLECKDTELKDWRARLKSLIGDSAGSRTRLSGDPDGAVTVNFLTESCVDLVGLKQLQINACKVSVLLDHVAGFNGC